MPAGQQEHHLVLRVVRVLVLVDEDVLETLPIVLQHVGVVTEQFDGLAEQIVEVHRAGLQQARLVLGVHIGMLAIEDVLPPDPLPRPA